MLGLVLSMGFVSFSAWAGVNSPDPTKPLIGTKTVKLETKKVRTPYVLQSIFLTNSLKIARINNRNVKEGGHVLGATVHKIEKNEVVLDINGSFKTLRLGAINTIIKKSVNR
jgi:hypothetical protein